jgi:hypothetical protein
MSSDSYQLSAVSYQPTTVGYGLSRLMVGGLDGTMGWKGEG